MHPKENRGVAEESRGFLTATCKIGQTEFRFSCSSFLDRILRERSGSQYGQSCCSNQTMHGADQVLAQQEARRNAVRKPFQAPLVRPKNGIRGR